MDDKFVYGLLGVALGAVLTTIFSVVKELYAEHRSKKKEAEYLAIRIVCLLESFMEGCVSVINDDGLCHGQTDPDGFSSIQVSAPQLDIQISDVNWKSLPPELMYEILYFPNMIKDAERFIDSTYEYAATPPDYSEFFEERQYQYSELGLLASKLSRKLRTKYQIPKKHISSWDIVEYMNTERTKIMQIRSKRAEEISKIVNNP